MSAAASTTFKGTLAADRDAQSRPPPGHARRRSGNREDPVAGARIRLLPHATSEGGRSAPSVHGLCKDRLNRIPFILFLAGAFLKDPGPVGFWRIACCEPCRLVTADGVVREGIVW